MHENQRMTKVRVNYDGWLALPAAVRQKLGVAAGDQLEIEVSDGAAVLRPVRAGTAGQAAALPEAAEPEALPTAVLPPDVKRRPGRPRKSAVPVVPPQGCSVLAMSGL